jgi:hypothetical protein
MNELQMPMLIAQLFGGQTPFTETNQGVEAINKKRVMGKYNVPTGELPPIEQGMPDMEAMKTLLAMYGMGKPGDGGVTQTSQKNLGFMDMLQGAGSVASIAKLFCWVAREVYGENNPQWLVFKSWLEYRAPKWFFYLYAKYGKQFAKFISNKPRLKNIVRKWMDKRVHKYIGEVLHG